MFGKGRERSDQGLWEENHSYLKILKCFLMGSFMLKQSVLVLLLIKLCCKGWGQKDLNAHHHSQRKSWGHPLWEWANFSRDTDYLGSYS